MKAPSTRYFIKHYDFGWIVAERATGKIVWRGKTFKGARTAHAQRELGVSYAVARRMGN